MGTGTVISILIGLAIGGAFGYMYRKNMASKQVGSAEERAQKLLDEAKRKEQEVMLQAKEKAIKVIDDAKKEENERREELRHMQQRLEKRESRFDQKLMNLEKKTDELTTKGEEIEKAKEEIKQIKEQQIEKLQKVANLSQAEAEQKLTEYIEKTMKDELMTRVRKVQEEVSSEYEKQAQKILIDVIQRCSMSNVADAMTSSVELKSDEMKGRIIGKEGRNIKLLEQLTGVEIIIDDTPNMITLSSFSPLRRHVCSVALKKLMVDGRIHPARIEEVVAEAKREIAAEIRKTGEEAAYQAGVAGLDPKLLSILGRLKFRTSYGQNQLNHSIEVAHIAGMLAEYLGADVGVVKKAALLHDIGKALDQEMQGTHTQIGAEICRKFQLPEDVVTPVERHHDDGVDHLPTIIVKVADAISGGRPGARRDSYEEYIQRLTDLENIATKYDGVEKAYALQAGREVRVFVKPEGLDDMQALKLARQIANQIEDQLKYPGEIKVNVIRETRAIEYAR